MTEPATYAYPHAPPELLEGLRRYADERLPVGGLLTAILENDLARAVAVLHRSLGVDALRDLVWYVHNEIPSHAHGSPARVVQWLAGNPASIEANLMNAVREGAFDTHPALQEHIGVLKRVAADEPLTQGEGFYLGGLLMGVLMRAHALEAGVRGEGA